MTVFQKIILYPARLISVRVFFLLSLFIPLTAQTQVYYYEINEAVEKLYGLSEELKLKEARAFSAKVKKEQPGNLLLYHIDNYADFYEIFISEEEHIYEKYSAFKEERLKQLKKGDASSPYYLFSQAEVLLQWALVDLKFKNYVSALYAIHKATTLLEENKRKFPEFIWSDKSLSVIHAIVGTIPDLYKKPLSWISSFEGTIEQGYREICDMTCSVETSNVFYKEVYVIKALIELHLVDDKMAAWSTVSQTLLDEKSTPLLQFILANVAHRTYHNDIALSILRKRKKEEEIPFFYLDYLQGAYALNNLEDDADIHLLSYVHHFKGKNYIKDAYLKLAWHAYAVKHDEALFYSYLNQIKVNGESITDEDKYALEIAEKGALPNRTFLRSRLLFDGGYFERSYRELMDIEKHVKVEDQNEFMYRKSRILFEKKQYVESITGFRTIINQAERSYDFYVTALFYTGLSYERMGEIDKAISFYELVLKQDSGAYKTSLHQKAKAGLMRLRS